MTYLAEDHVWAMQGGTQKLFLRAQTCCMHVCFTRILPHTPYFPFVVCLCLGLWWPQELVKSLEEIKTILFACSWCYIYLKFKTSTLSAGAKKLLSTLRELLWAPSAFWDLCLGEHSVLAQQRKKKGITMMSLLFTLLVCLFYSSMTFPALHACTPQL